MQLSGAPYVSVELSPRSGMILFTCAIELIFHIMAVIVSVTNPKSADASACSIAPYWPCGTGARNTYLETKRHKIRLFLKGKSLDTSTELNLYFASVTVLIEVLQNFFENLGTWYSDTALHTKVVPWFSDRKMTIVEICSMDVSGWVKLLQHCWNSATVKGYTV